MNRKKVIFKASLIAAPVALMMASSAQAAETVAKPFSVSVGAGYLLQGSARDDSGSTGLAIGAGYTLPSKSLLMPGIGVPSIDLSYNHNSGHGNRDDSYGVTYTERLPISSAVKGPKTYVGIGIGVYRTDIGTHEAVAAATPGSTPTPTSTPTSNFAARAAASANGGSTVARSKSNTQLGGKILVGMDFGNAFAEVSYKVSGSSVGLRSDTIDLTVGTHF